MSASKEIVFPVPDGISSTPWPYRRRRGREVCMASQISGSVM